MVVPAPRAPPSRGRGDQRQTNRRVVHRRRVSAGAACHVRSIVPANARCMGQSHPPCPCLRHANPRSRAACCPVPGVPIVPVVPVVPVPSRGSAWIPGEVAAAWRPRRGSVAARRGEFECTVAREEELVRPVACASRGARDLSPPRVQKLRGTIGLSDPECASVTNSSTRTPNNIRPRGRARHLARRRRRRDGRDPRPTGTCCARPRGRNRRRSGRGSSPVTRWRGARVAQVGDPANAAGTPAGLALGSVASPGTRGGGFESRAAIRVAILRPRPKRRGSRRRVPPARRRAVRAAR